MKDFLKSLYPTDSASRPLWWLALLAPFAAGLFYEWTAGLASLVLIALLFLCWKRNRWRVELPLALPLLAAVLIVLFYGLSVFWATDKGMAPFGFVKFLPVLLFALLIAPLSQEQRESLLETLPIGGAVITVLSFVGKFLPVVGEYFTVSGRLAGMFQYPNTYGLYLLLGLAILGRKHLSWPRLACAAILLFGVFQSGSRSVFVLLVVLVITLCVTHPEKKGKLLWACLLAAGIAGAVAYVLITGNTDTVGRFLTSSLESSTLVGRLLYWKDALPMIAKHPFGLGYLGYRYLQGSFQTGVYTLQFVHNDLLQLLLDIGWLPALALLAAIFHSLFSKRVNATQKLVLLVLCAHALFDFDLQFVALWFILLACLDYAPIKGKEISCKTGVITAGAGALGLVTVYFSAAHFLAFLHLDAAATSLYPAYTSAWVEQLPQAETAEEMDALADKIITTNESASLAWSAKARAAYSQGDFAAMMEYKEKAISLARYELDEYLDYFDMLWVGVQLYAQAGDETSAEICVEKLKEIPQMLEQVLEETDALAWKIDETPELELPEEYREILDSLSE